MSDYPSKKLLISLFTITALASGGAVFWSTWNPGGQPRPLPLEAVAQAAPSVKAPRAKAPKAAPTPSVKPASKAERDAVQKVISAQLHAFDVGNWKEAAKYQSAGLKQNFPSPEAFGQMIQKVYPAFVNAKKVSFGSAQNVAGRVQIEVSLTRQDDEVTKVLYALAKEKEGYRIEAVLGGETVQNENATVT